MNTKIDNLYEIINKLNITIQELLIEKNNDNNDINIIHNNDKNNEINNDKLNNDKLNNDLEEI